MRVRGISILLLALILFGCSSGTECRENLEIYLAGKVYNVVFDENRDAYVSQALYIPLRINGLGVDSLLMNSSSVSELKVPLNKFDTVSSFEFTTLKLLENDTLTVSDTVTFYYKNREEMVSVQCGCIVNHTLVDVRHTTHLIDSVVIVNDEVSRISSNNLNLYYNLNK